MWEDFCDAFICFPDDPFKKSLKFLPHQFVSLRFKTNATMLQNFNHKLKDQSSFKNISSEFYGTLGAIKLVWGCNIFAKKCAQGVCEGEGASWVTGGFHGSEGAAEAGEGADRICGLDLQGRYEQLDSAMVRKAELRWNAWSLALNQEKTIKDWTVNTDI